MKARLTPFLGMRRTYIFCFLMLSFCQLSLADIEITSVSCICNDDGAIDLTVTTEPGSPFTYQWSGPNGYTSTVEDPNDLQYPGMYSVTVTNAYGCTAVLSTEVVTCVSYIFDLTQPQSGSDRQGEVTVKVVPVNEAYGVEVVDEAGTIIYSNTEDGNISLSFDPGTYCITVTDLNGCNIEECFQICRYPGINPVVEHACEGESNGSIYMNVIPFTGNYFFIWSNGSTTEDITDLAPGTYAVTINPYPSQCSFVEEFTVGTADIMVGAPSVQHPTYCSSSDGSISFLDEIPTGGTGPFTYAWDNGQTGPAISGLMAGNYTVTISDANGCNNEFTYALIDEELPLILEVVEESADIGGACNGSITVQVTFEENNAFLFVYLNGIYLTGANLVQNGSGVHVYTFENLCASQAPGDYSIVARVYESFIVCDVNENATVPSCPQINITGAPPTISLPSSCSAADGSIFFNGIPTGAAQPVTCEWSNGITGGCNYMDGLSPGIYTLTYTDANGCTGERSFDLRIEESIEYLFVSGIQNATPPLEGTGCNGSIQIYALGFDYPITLLIEGEGVSQEVTYTSGSQGGELTYTFYGLCEGEYTVTATEGNGCSSTVGGTVLGCPNINIPSPNFNNASSCLASDGIISLFGGGGPGGGQPNYTYQLTNEMGQTVPGTNVWVNLSVGTYTLHITDYFGCVGSQEYLISSEDSPEIISQFFPECEGLENGLLEVQAISTIETAFSYEISSDQLPQNIVAQPGENESVLLENLTAGEYCILVTGLTSGCTSEHCGAVELIPSRGEFMLVNPSNPGVSAPYFETTKSCPEQPTGTITFWIMGGTPPYTIVLNNGATVTSGENPPEPTPMVIEALPSGNYSTVEIHDLPYCNRMIDNVSSIEVGEYPLLQITSVPLKDCPGAGEIDLTVTGGAGGPFTFLWDNGATTEDLSGLSEERTYSVTVTDTGDGSNCTKTHTVALDLWERATVNADETVEVSCPDWNPNADCIGLTGAIGKIEISNISGDTRFANPTIEWSNGQNGMVEIENLNDGIYTLTVNDGCFETVRTFNIAQGTILDESDNPTNCFDRVLCQHPTNNNISYPVDVCWSGYYNDPEVTLDGTTCVATVTCGNNEVDLPYYANSSTVDYRGGNCYCDELRNCQWQIYDLQGTSFTDAYDVPHQTNNFPIDIFVNDDIWRGNYDGNYFTGEEPASSLGGSCDPNKLAVGQVCGNQGVVCEECEDCIPSNSSTPTMPNGDCENCICFVEVTCGDHARTIEGTIEFDFNTDVDPNLDIAGCRLCEGGNFCKITINCYVAELNISVHIKDVIDTGVSYVDDGTGNPVPCESGQPNSCTVKYSCENNVEFHSWCDSDCSPIFGIGGTLANPTDDLDYECDADPYPFSDCPNVGPPTVAERSIGNGRIIKSIRREILEGNHLKIVSVYPNPFDDILNIEINSNYSNKISLKIFDSFGRIVANTDKVIIKGKNYFKLRLHNRLPDGIYYLSIIDNDGYSLSTKIISKKN